MEGCCRGRVEWRGVVGGEWSGGGAVGGRVEWRWCCRGESGGEVVL